MADLPNYPMADPTQFAGLAANIARGPDVQQGAAQLAQAELQRRIMQSPLSPAQQALMARYLGYYGQDMYAGAQPQQQQPGPTRAAPAPNTPNVAPQPVRQPSSITQTAAGGGPYAQAAQELMAEGKPQQAQPRIQQEPPQGQQPPGMMPGGPYDTEERATQLYGGGQVPADIGPRVPMTLPRNQYELQQMMPMLQQMTMLGREGMRSAMQREDNLAKDTIARMDNTIKMIQTKGQIDSTMFNGVKGLLQDARDRQTKIMGVLGPLEASLSGLAQGGSAPEQQSALQYRNYLRSQMTDLDSQSKILQDMLTKFATGQMRSPVRETGGTTGAYDTSTGTVQNFSQSGGGGIQGTTPPSTGMGNRGGGAEQSVSEPSGAPAPKASAPRNQPRPTTTQSADTNATSPQANAPKKSPARYISHDELENKIALQVQQEQAQTSAQRSSDDMATITSPKNAIPTLLGWTGRAPSPDAVMQAKRLVRSNDTWRARLKAEASRLNPKDRANLQNVLGFQFASQ